MPVEKNQQADHLTALRRTFATADLLESEVRAIAEARMDPRHDDLNALLDPK
jgi:hypothetical protein